MKVLFVFFTDPPRPFSSSVAALSAVARAEGHAPDALEVSCKGSVAAAADEIVRRGPDVVAVSSMSRDWPGARAVLERVRPRSRAFVVVGGYHATLASLDVAACAAVDAIAIGEGERPLASLLRTLAAGEVPRTQPGLWARSRDGGFEGAPPEAAPEPDIARLPPWDYEVFGDVQAILREGVNTFGPHVDRFLPVRASRGCPYECAYCSAPAWGEVGGHRRPGRVNVRPVEHLLGELAVLRDHYAPEGFEFWDEHFPISVDWLRALARAYPRRVGLPFKVEMHPSAATRERLALLAEAGCVLFHAGVEAGDEALRRDVLRRRTPDAVLERVFEDCRALGLATSASLMTMLPGETRAQMVSTKALLEKLRPGSFVWSTYQPLPGTRLGDAAVRAWPAPARERLDDHPPLETTTPACVSAAEREETFRELAALQTALVAAASEGRAARARPVDVPATAAAPPPGLAELLGLEAPSAPLDRGVRLNAAAWRGGVVTLELEAVDLAPHAVTIGANDGGRFYRATPQLGLSYRGRAAPPRLLSTLDSIAARLDGLGPDDLARLFAGEGAS